MTRNELGLLEVSGKSKCINESGVESNAEETETQRKIQSAKKPVLSFLPTSDSEDSDSIDLTCKEDAPSSPSKHIARISFFEIQ